MLAPAPAHHHNLILFVSGANVSQMEKCDVWLKWGVKQGGQLSRWRRSKIDVHLPRGAAMAKPSAHKTHFSPNGGLIKKLGTHFRTPLPTASVSTLNSDQHLGVTIVVVVRRIIVAVFRVVVVAVLVPLRPDGQLMCHHHHQEEGDQDQQEADQDQTWPIKKWAN